MSAFASRVMFALAAAIILVGGAAAQAEDDTDVGNEKTECSCPAVVCKSGATNACSASCEGPEEAVCDCEATCSDSGAPVGQNSCQCE